MFDPGPIGLHILRVTIEVIGLHGIFGFFCGILIVLGFIKLAFGNILFCRKTKARAFEDELKKKGLIPKRGTANLHKDTV